MSCESYRRTLHQPYTVHIQRNTAEVITSITTQIGVTVLALNAFLQLATASLVSVGLLIGLFLIDAQVALGTAVIFGCVYGLLAVTVRRQLRRNGLRIADISSRQIKALQEGLGAIRDVLLDGTQHTYVQTYRNADLIHRQLQATNAFLGTFPRYALEAVGMVGISLLGGILVIQRGSSVGVIPLLGSLALGAQRLLPALQQVYGGWAALRSYNAAIHDVLVMLSQPMPTYVISADSLRLKRTIRFEGVEFSYGTEQPKVIQRLDLVIRCGERIGVVGNTGSGKSTMIDLLMALLAPTAGKVLIDEEDIHDPLHPERLVAWRAAIAHVPQNIYLADSSIAENIAFGIPRHLIDIDRVKQVAAQAQIASFIESKSDGYESFVGERGIRLSGGQRQRLGIARALYKQSKILVLDEATSALDTDTEEAVMAAIDSLNQNITVIMIAHRVSTVLQCDVLFVLRREEF